MRKSFIGGLAAIVGGTALSLAGCRNEIKDLPIQNLPPEISVSELDGTPVNSTNDGEIIENDSCDDVYLLSLPRGNLQQDQLRFNVLASDPEKKRINANAYATLSSNNPIRVNIDQGANTRYEVNWEINVEPTDDSVPLGTYHMFDITASDGVNSAVACFYGAVGPGTTVPPGQIPQDDGDGGNVTCYTDSDCEMPEVCVDGTCVPHEDDNNDLANLIKTTCNLTRSTGTDIKFYELVKDAQGNYKVNRELGELTPNPNNSAAEGNSIHHLIPTGTSGKVYAAVGGMQTGNYTISEVARVRVMAKGMSSPIGMVPEQCDYAIILNPNSESLDPQVFSVTYTSN